MGGPINVFALTACDFGGGEVKDCDLETVTVLVVGEVLGGDMLFQVKSTDGLDGEFAQPCRGIKTGGEAHENGGVKGVVEVKVLFHCSNEGQGVWEVLFALFSPGVDFSAAHSMVSISFFSRAHGMLCRMCHTHTPFR